MNLTERSAFIKKTALELGFSHCGISKAGFLSEEAPRLERWLKEGRHGKMSYMERYFDKRLNPEKLVEGAKSVVSLLLNYYPAEEKPFQEVKISRYAYGKDYHGVIKEKLRVLHTKLEERIGKIDGRAFTDSAPVMDKAWARRSGLGWVGRNTNLITKNAGSYFFIAELILDIELQADAPVADHCGSCRACLEACPTGALTNAYEIDASKCISYLTIELKDRIPPEFSEKMEGWVFGCDSCQEVCPWNRFSRPHSEPAFLGTPPLTPREWEELTEEVFVRRFSESPLSRAGLKKLQNTVTFAAG
ncbi:MAG: tRNA epoxyqueuosine(34) reductase QueG [Bacteroidia bacterium]|nr:tRNA epoxyqueuosine(34) reductase QueG [Bacteroidia bacterium]